MTSTPIVISTWPFGLPANAAAFALLTRGESSLDAVEAGVRYCERDTDVDSVGLGGLPDADGNVTLDASIMDHAGRCGGVACVRTMVNVITLARRVMEKTPHVLLVGESADAFAREEGFPVENLLTPKAAAAYEAWKREHPPKPIKTHDTIGMLALDSSGRLAGACSTSGWAYKKPGRVGDSPIVGAGLYVDGKIGAASCTGRGEESIKSAGSYQIVENLRRGMDPQAAIADVLRRIVDRRNGDTDVDISYIALRVDGLSAGMSLRPATNFKYALTRAQPGEVIAAPTLV